MMTMAVDARLGWERCKCSSCLYHGGTKMLEEEEEEEEESLEKREGKDDAILLHLV